MEPITSSRLNGFPVTETLQEFFSLFDQTGPDKTHPTPNPSAPGFWFMMAGILRYHCSLRRLILSDYAIPFREIRTMRVVMHEPKPVDDQSRKSAFLAGFSLVGWVW